VEGVGFSFASGQSRRLVELFDFDFRMPVRGSRRWPVARLPDAGLQGMGLANFAGSGAGWSVSTFCRAITPPVGSLTMSDTTVFATL
jgi:hypothetical protein